MNYSQAGTPTSASKPGVDKRIDDRMEILLEQKMILEDAINNYTEQIAKDDFWSDWYVNAMKHYTKKLAKVEIEIINITGYKIESTKGIEAKEPEPDRTGPPPVKEEAVKSKKH